MGRLDHLKGNFVLGLLLLWALLTGYLVASVPLLISANKSLNTKLELIEYDIENVAVLLRTRGVITNRDLENFFVSGIVDNSYDRDSDEGK